MFLNAVEFPILESWPKTNISPLIEQGLETVSCHTYAFSRIQSNTADLGGTAGSGPDLCDKVSIAIKLVIIFLLVEGLAFNLFKKKKSVVCEVQ